MRMLIVTCLIGAFAGGCDTPNFRTSRFEFGDAKVLAATGNLRFVTERERPGDPERFKIVCTEPSPDYAVAASQKYFGQFSNVPSAGASVIGGQAEVNLSEAVSNLGGRSAGVLALRDGLYAACQAYANGIIGKDAYSMVISQYGLLVATVAKSGNIVVDAAGRPVGEQGAVGKETAAASAFAAVLVACISAYDPTRPSSGYNAILDRPTCRRALRTAASGSQG